MVAVSTGGAGVVGAGVVGAGATGGAEAADAPAGGGVDRGSGSANGVTLPSCSGSGGRNTAWSSRRTSGAGSTARTPGRAASSPSAAGAARTTAA